MQVLRYFLAVPVRKRSDELFFFPEAQAEGRVAPVLPGAGGERAGGKEESSRFAPGSPERFALLMGSKSVRARCAKTTQKEESSALLLQPEWMRFKVGGDRGKVTDAPGWSKSQGEQPCSVPEISAVLPQSLGRSRGDSSDPC